MVFVTLSGDVRNFVSPHMSLGTAVCEQTRSLRLSEGKLLVTDPDSHLAPRRCLKEPIPEIFEAASLLSEAVDAHLAGDGPRADRLIRAAGDSRTKYWFNDLNRTGVSTMPVYVGCVLRGATCN